MFVDFDYSELLTISCALHTLDIVYGPAEVRDSVMAKVDNLMDEMNNLPIDQLYPGLCANVEGVGTIST